MLHYKDIDTELECLAMQDGTGSLPEIPKLSPAQMAALATALGRKHGIKVEFGDFSTAATDGNRILLPLTNRENSFIIRGFLDHEVAHVRLTDFGYVPASPGLKKTLWNVVEDIRIEAQMSAFYPGMGSNYRALIRELRQTDAGFFEIDENASPEILIATYISLMLRALHLRQAELADLAIETRRLFRSAFGQQLEQGLFSVIAKIGYAVNSSDVADLVEEIIELLAQYAAEPGMESEKMQYQAEPPADEHDQGDDPGNTGNNAGNQAEDSTEAGNNAQSEPGDHSKLAQDTDDDQAECGTCSGDGDADPTDAISSDQASRRAAIKQALDSQEEIGDFGDQLRNLARQRESGSICQEIQIARPATPDELTNAGYQHRPIKASTHLVAQLSSRLRGLLQAEGLKHSKPSMSGNRIARQRLHRIKTGEPRLFLRKHTDTMVNTALHILVDNSASMDENSRFRITREVALALAKAMEPIRGINLAVTVFPGFYPYRNRQGNVQIPVAAVLSHGRRPGNTMLYPREPEGQTPLDAAVRYAASSMLGLAEPRRILVILTDGEPESEEAAEAAIQEAQDLGIEIVCLGIEEIVCPRIFPRFEVVNSVTDLPKKGFSLLESLLTKKP